MTAEFSRRSLLAGMDLLAAGAALEACCPPTAERQGTTAPAPASTVSPYLAGNYAPVDREVTATDLVVTGRLPGAFSGHFVRNGPNPVTLPTGPNSWFGGDGCSTWWNSTQGAPLVPEPVGADPPVASALGEQAPVAPCRSRAWTCPTRRRPGRARICCR